MSAAWLTRCAWRPARAAAAYARPARSVRRVARIAGRIVCWSVALPILAILAPAQPVRPIGDTHAATGFGRELGLGGLGLGASGLGLVGSDAAGHRTLPAWPSHGVVVLAADIAPTDVPEPAGVLLLVSALLAVVATKRAGNCALSEDALT